MMLTLLSTGILTLAFSTKPVRVSTIIAQACRLDLTQLANSVSQESPSNAATETQWSVDFNYTVTYYDTPRNASIRIFNSTDNSLITTVWNNTALQNGASVNYGSYTFSVEQDYKWDCIYYNNSDNSWQSSSNWTLTVDVPPRYQNVGQNATFIPEGGTIKLYAEGYDGIGLDQSWLWTNETGGDGKNYTEFASSGVWVQKADMPHARQYAQQAVVDGKIYVIGGRVVPSDGRFDYNEMYNPANDLWVSKTPMPVQQDAAAIGVYNGNIYVAGGYPVGNDHYVYYPSNDSWSDSPADLPVTRWDCGGAVVDGYFYVVGGSSDHGEANQYETLYRYSFADDSWTKMADMNYKHAKVGVAVHNNDIYAFCSDWQVRHEHVEKYNIENNSWTVLSDCPIGHHACVTVGDVIYFLAAAGTICELDFWAYNPKTDSYTPVTDFDEFYALHTQLQLVAVNNTVYHIGGGWRQNEGDTPDEYDGVWVINVTGGFYGSPINMNDASNTWMDTNYTWSNNSISAGTTIQWRIYYNDTLGNVNGTHACTILVTVRGDVNGDTFVDINDLYDICRSYEAIPSSPNWNETCDINGDNIIDEIDLSILEGNYGKRA